MLSMILTPIFGVLADAFSLRNAGCQFGMRAEGAIAGPVGEMRSGQVRAGEGISSSTFVLKGDELWDSEGKGCWWTPPTYVLQCDVDQAPEKGFEIGCDGVLSHKGRRRFYECRTGESGQYNIYLEAQNQGICGEVTLRTEDCRSDCPASAPAPTPEPQPATEDLHLPISTGCPTNLTGPFEFPHLIVPVDQSHPDQALGTSFFGEVSPSITSLFNFDIPSTDKSKQCTLIFLLPPESSSAFTLSGSGKLSFYSLATPATEGTTHDSRPSRKQDLGVFEVKARNGYSIATFDCPAGERISFAMASVDEEGEEGTRMRWFQEYDASPVGLYITKCQA